MVLIFAQLPPVPAPPVSPWVGMTHEWIGWDGSVWDLAAGAQGVVLLRDGVEGLHFPKIVKHRSTSRVVPGARLRGWRAGEREAFWPLLIHVDTSSSDYVARADAFFRTISPDRPGTWRVGAGGKFRELNLTGVFDSSHSYGVDPVYAGWGMYKIALEATQPFWTGSAVERGPWKAPSSQDFRPAGGTPMFYLSSSSAFGNASIPNPGDVEAFPVWTVEGPLEEIELGIGDRVIEVPFEVSDGETLVIDTDPRNVTATLDGVDVTEDLGFQPLAPIPPSESAELHVQATGTGSVAISLVPLFFRAY